jgi:hypothetical protein
LRDGAPMPQGGVPGVGGLIDRVRGQYRGDPIVLAPRAESSSAPFRR